MLKKFAPLIVLLVVCVLALLNPGLPKETITEGLDSGDIAWLLTSAAFVLLMTPGLAFFYGGMVNPKNVISTMLQSFVAMGIISILWVVIGFSMAFGDSFGGFVGDPRTYFMFNGVLEHAPFGTIPFVLFAFFQLKFAVITPALFTGSFSERIRFTSYIIFMILFCLFIYTPIAHWTWHADGFLYKMGVLDFAGGTVVHMSAGCAALAGAIYLGKRKDKNHPTAINVPYILLGTGLLWFGWFGFNAGSAAAANPLAASAFAATNVAAGAAGIAWLFVEAARGKKPSAMGFSIGAVVGLVAITPAAGFVTVSQALFIGSVASMISAAAIVLLAKTSIADDTLDVFPCHGVGGMTGMIMTGLFASTAVNAAVAEQGLFIDGSTTLILKHLLALVIVVAYSLIGSYILLFITDKISPLRVTAEEEELGLDTTQHDEKFVIADLVKK
ncbi:ammonium transporter [Cytophaga hutchinsonii]|jgi:Amt family ammonium transporter|uniref:Ammonium transporter n=1 Tax=Cytophaga hutchinsonii (strain ATCC 33406 / DSM 1761 / CIP 103989 / NBRC 15051 / NCIMB 9469 / D465) TaxID=269798 RepID=A0A6N4SVZ5_CYTH3|nr:ammonium transporter [Cytophaga hutchinsonii]ABG60553.1 ammonium transporter [Cytophaga hutchinsonii ATCC 33406]SFX90209.1 ammonium transporter [Cytophaga hutchinsonii ATCC 33406]